MKFGSVDGLASKRPHYFEDNSGKNSIETLTSSMKATRKNKDMEFDSLCSINVEVLDDLNPILAHFCNLQNTLVSRRDNEKLTKQ